MRMWLAPAAAVSLMGACAAHGQSLASVATGAKSADPSAFALPSIPQFDSGSPIHDGMIAQEDLAPNAHVGLGLAPMLGRNIHSVRIEQEPVPTRNPGVTFVLKFPG